MKKWWQSKAVWLNILGTAIAITQAIQGEPWIDPEIQIGILAGLNALVRILTNVPIAGTPGAKGK